MNRLIAAALALSVAASTAVAGGRGGHNITFDPNLFGGNWTTITCTGVFATDTAAVDAWKATAAAANPAWANLRFVSGPTTPCNVTDWAILSTTGAGAFVRNARVWMHGATLYRPFWGPIGSGSLTLPLPIDAVSSGATRIHLKTASDAANFTAGNYMLTMGLENQALDCGFPPNPSFFSLRLVTASSAITGNVDFTPALDDTFLETWPLVCGDGPAAAIAYGDKWNQNYELYGGFIVAPPSQGGQMAVNGRTALVNDQTNTLPDGSFVATDAESITLHGGQFQFSEIDKLVGRFTLDAIQSPSMGLQSASIKNVIVTRSRVTLWVGTGQDSKFIGNTIGQLWLGPNGYGGSKTILIDNTRVPSTSTSRGSIQSIPIISLTYSNGTFSIAKGAGQQSAFLHMGVLGHKYTVGEAALSPLGSPTVAFTITAVREDGSNYYWDTDLVGALPSSTCGGSACTQIVSYPGVVTQINKQASDFNFSIYSQP